MPASTAGDSQAQRASSTLPRPRILAQRPTDISASSGSPTASQNSAGNPVARSASANGM